MFGKLDLTEWNLLDFGQLVGIVRSNNIKLRNDMFASLISRVNAPYRVTQIGRVNYAFLDDFIIKSLNDYYGKLNVGNASERSERAKNYNRLYASWNAINQAKAYPDMTLNDLYDNLVYELYLLGYKQ